MARNHYLEEKGIISIIDQKNYDSLPPITVKIGLYKNCYTWLQAFCALLKTDFLAFFTREFNAYFSSYHGEKRPLIRESYLKLIKEIG